MAIRLCFAAPAGHGHTNIECGSVHGGRSDSDVIFDVNKDNKITVADQLLMAKNTCSLKPWLLGCAEGVCPAE
jgi:hypothetical protein